MKRRGMVGMIVLSGAVAMNGVASAQVDCFAPSPLAEPPECGGMVSPAPVGGGLLEPTDNAFAHEIRDTDNYVFFILADFPGQAVVGNNTQDIYGYALDSDQIAMYAIDGGTQTLGTVIPDGTFTPIGTATPCAGCNWTGLAWDPRGPVGPLYGMAVDGAQSCLYRLDTATGAATEVGCQATAGLLIDLAMNCRGELWSHDIGDDTIYRVDPSSGSVTAVGPTGVDSNFAQGMSFDRNGGSLYAFTYQGGGANTYGWISQLSGQLQALATSNPAGEFEGETLTACGTRASLTTLFAQNNSFAGNTFDLQPAVDIQVAAFAVNLAAGSATTMEIYMREGTALGFESDPAGWTSLGQAGVTPAGPDVETLVPLSTPTLGAGQTYGFYVDVLSYPSAALQYTNGGPTVYSNADLSLTTYHGKGNPAFTGSSFFPRQWNGTVYYVVVEGIPFYDGFESGGTSAWTSTVP